METTIARECRLSEELPGPGRYEPLKKTQSHQGFTISTSRRSTDRNQNLNATESFVHDRLLQNRKKPGPTEYSNMVSSFSKAHGLQGMVSFTKQKTKRKMDEMDPQIVYSLDSPGPGSYTYANNSFGTSARTSKVSTARKTRTESMGLENQQRLQNPGPGEYRILPTIGANKKSLVSMKTSSYRELFDGVPRDARNSPDTGTYDIEPGKSLTQSGVKFGLFGKSIR